MDLLGELPEYPYDVPTTRILCRVCAVFDFRFSDCEKVKEDEDVENLMKDVIRHLDLIDSMHPGFRDHYEERLVEDVSDAMLYLVQQMLQYKTQKPLLSKLVVHNEEKERTYIYVVKLHPQ